MDLAQSSVLRDIILNTRKPIVLRKFCPNWKSFDCPIDEWCNKFDALSDNGRPEFEKMPIKFGDFPQWERHRSKTEMTLTDFIDVHSKDEEHWVAFNYHRVEEIPLECRYDIDLSCFGFPEASKDASLWLSSKGANTPCHFDTYGCNIVVQVYGRLVRELSLKPEINSHSLRKHWLLFPPETKLTPIRIPYEESSIYCSENFFSPKNLESLSVARQNAFECILGEGDVLIVPRHWWHYVESLGTSLSVNAWIPLEIDIDAQIQECIVKYIVEKSVHGESKGKKQYILNPNQLEFITSSDEIFGILRFLLEKRNTTQCKKYPYQYLSESDVNELIGKLQYDVSVLNSLPPIEFDNLMHAKTKRYVVIEPPGSSKIDPIHEALLNSICHPNVINAIKDKFLKTFSSCI